MFSRRCATDDVPGMRRIVVERCRSQASAAVCGVRPSRAATLLSTSDWSECEAAQGEERRVGDIFPRTPVDELVVITTGDVVKVLHGHDRRDRLRFGQLL